MIHLFKIVLVSLFAISIAFRLPAQNIAIKTNGILDLALTPNLACELVTGNASSLDISIFGHYKPYTLNSKLIGIQPEFRYWISGRPMIREYLGLSALAVSYNITWKEYVYQGDALGLGLTVGHALDLGKRFNVEFHGGVGVVRFWQKLYYKYDNYEHIFIDEKRRTNSHGYKIIPFKLGISFAYIIR